VGSSVTLLGPAIGRNSTRPSGTPGATVRRVHPGMIVFAAGRREALKRFLLDDGAGQDARFWRLAQALSALHPAGSEENRWGGRGVGAEEGVGAVRAAGMGHPSGGRIVSQQGKGRIPGNGAMIVE
jgi:hypothetical protein